MGTATKQSDCILIPFPAGLKIDDGDLGGGGNTAKRFSRRGCKPADLQARAGLKTQVDSKASVDLQAQVGSKPQVDSGAGVGSQPQVGSRPQVDLGAEVGLKTGVGLRASVDLKTQLDSSVQIDTSAHIDLDSQVGLKAPAGLAPAGIGLEHVRLGTGYGQSEAYRYRRVASNGTVDPIRNKHDRELIKSYLLTSSGRHAVRNYTIFVLGMNSALRGGDLVACRLVDVYEEDFTPKQLVRIVERKTGKIKEFALRDTARQALEMYRDCFDSFEADAYLFPSQKVNRDSRPDCTGKTHITRRAFGNILKQVQKDLADKLSEQLNLGTHSMRKTFSADFLDRAEDSKYAIISLMNLLNHSSPETTLRYAGLRKEQLMKAYSLPGL